MKRGDERRFVPAKFGFDAAVAHKKFGFVWWLFFQLENHFDFDART
jgi:hypothetical protein